MSPYQIQGLVSVMIGATLVVSGLVALLLSAFRLLLVQGRPDRGHLARAIRAASTVWITIGAGIVLVAELTDHQRLMDRVGAPALAAISVLGGLWLATRLRRRGRARSRADAETPAAPQPPDAAR